MVNARYVSISTRERERVAVFTDSVVWSLVVKRGCVSAALGCRHRDASLNAWARLVQVYNHGLNRMILNR